VKEVEKIFIFAGWDKKKNVSFLEFFSANIDFKKSLTEAHIQYLFNSIDANQNE
jgi:nucleosome binding factor SPN SPT16 subunit